MCRVIGDLIALLMILLFNRMELLRLFKLKSIFVITSILLLQFVSYAFSFKFQQCITYKNSSKKADLRKPLKKPMLNFRIPTKT